MPDPLKIALQWAEDLIANKINDDSTWIGYEITPQQLGWIRSNLKIMPCAEEN